VGSGRGRGLFFWAQVRLVYELGVLVRSGVSRQWDTCRDLDERQNLNTTSMNALDLL